MKKLLTLVATLVFASWNLHAAEAKAIWAKDCSKCHGADGRGKTGIGVKLGSKDYTDAGVQSELKDGAMAKAIKEGTKKGGNVTMKAFPDLTDQEIAALVAYVRVFKK